MNYTIEVDKVIGFERVFAAVIALGEIDGHPGNVGVSKITLEDGVDKLLAKKIDHGRCMHRFDNELYSYDNQEIGHLENITRYLKQLNYDYDSINSMFDPVKFVKALDEITQISEDEIRNIISQRVYDLYYLGMDFNVIATTYAFSMNNTQDPNELTEYLTANILHQMQVCRNLRDGLIKNGYVSEQDLKEDLSERQLNALDKGTNMFEALKAKHEFESKKEFTSKFGMVLNRELKDLLPAGTGFEFLDSNTLINDGHQLLLNCDTSNFSQVNYMIESLPKNFNAELVQPDKMTQALRISLKDVTSDDYAALGQCIESIKNSHYVATKVVLENLLGSILPNATFDVIEDGIQLKVAQNNNLDFQKLIETGKSMGFNFEETESDNYLKIFVSKKAELSVDELIESIAKRIEASDIDQEVNKEFKKRVEQERNKTAGTSVKVR